MSRDRSVRCYRCQVLNEPGAESCVRCGAVLAQPGRGTRRRRRFTLEGAILSLLILLILAMAIFVMATVIDGALHPAEAVDPFAGQSGTTASTSTTVAGGSDGQGSPTSTSLPALLLRPRAAASSSALKATNTHNYRATNLVDGDLTTAWNEGAEGLGTGEWVEFEFTRSVTLARLDVANGYQKDDDRFKGNVRIKTMKLEYSEGSTQLVYLLDTEAFQSINTLRVETDWIRLTILSVYPDYIWADAALSEVRMYELVDQK